MKPFRYIMTRRCLREETMHLTRRLEAEFPEDTDIRLYDEEGHEYRLSVKVADGCIYGAGPLFRDHSLGVNDVLLLTPLLPGSYRVETVVKPYERPTAGWKEGNASAETAAEPNSAESKPPHGDQPAHEGNRSARRDVAATARRRPAPTRPLLTASGQRGQPTQQRSGAHEGAQTPDADTNSQAAGVTVRAVKKQVAQETVARTKEGSAVAPSASAATFLKPAAGVQSSAEGSHETALSDVQNPSSGVRVRAVRSSEARGGHSEESGLSDGSGPSSEPAVQVRAVRRDSAQAEAKAEQGGQDGKSSGEEEGQEHMAEAGVSSLAKRAGNLLTRGRRSSKPAPAMAATQRLQRDISRYKEKELAASEGVSEAGAGDAAQRATPSNLALQELGRLTGYEVDYLGGGLTRLRADMGRYSHHVLIADSASAASSPEWRTRAQDVPTYKLWLVDEGQEVGDAPIVSREAVQTLLRQARLAPLSALDLRPYWHARRMDARSAEGLTSLAKHYVSQRGAFATVLAALAQLPANSIVSRARLAELPLGLPADELDKALETLCRAPMQLLTPLEKGEYLLRQNVSTFLAGFGGYVSDVFQRLETIRPQANSGRKPSTQNPTLQEPQRDSSGSEGGS